MSGGQQQRVAVARAVAGHPSILLADEPTGNLDSTNGEAVMELLRELHRGGATICMVTHDPRYAQHADRIVHLFDGLIVEEEAGSHRREIEEAKRELAESSFILLLFYSFTALPQKGLNTVFCLKKQVDRSSHRDSRPT